MGISLPTSLPVPRRFVILGVSAFIIVLILHTFAPSTLPPVLNPSPSGSSDGEGYSKWLPPIFSPGVETSDRPPEFDEDGQCLFLSPYDALSPAEKARAEAMELEEVSPGVVKLKNGGGVRIDELLEDDEPLNATMGMSHPILGLLRMGEKKWNEKLASQSKSLEEAAEKYKAKWGRNPPKGFNLWWQFGQSRNILLPDEFDSIMNALLPFYGLPVDVLQERMAETEKLVETFSLIVHHSKDGSRMEVELQWNDDYARDVWIASRNRADKQINLMESFISMLEPFRATYTIHDQPTILLDHERQQQLLTAARKNTVSAIHNDDDRHTSNWHGACGKDDPINRQGYEEPPATDTFINRHTAAMDICQHPSYLHNHGMLLEVKDAEAHPQPHTKLYPILVPSKTMLNADIPITPVGNDNGIDQVGADPEWNKKSNKMYWRGLATGMNHNKKSGAKWRQSHRERLHFLANDRKNLNQMILAPMGTTGEAEYAQYPLRELGEYYMDAKMSGGHWQCDWDDGTCQEMDDEIDWAGMDNAERSNEFKYVFDTDGNAWSSRFPRLMASNNVVIKASVFPEWNTQSLPEWYAYVPSKMDYSDLFSILAFFRGNPSGKGGHDEVARRIAVNSQCWVEKTWRKEDMQTYMFLLYLEYARLTSPDRDTGKMDYHFTSRHSKPAAAPVEHKPAEMPATDEVKAKEEESENTPMLQEVEDDGSLVAFDDDDRPLPLREKEGKGHEIPDGLKDDYIERMDDVWRRA